ncbi:MAG: hypothetical protein Hyperionvirus40_16 [Hyperionvirus sp.]|uniref:Uncharacterized protein n=1 Tax=Hyperionvirus sp. TaxID=2487770 RepID=A0A3G5ACD3_9VIRU|nr:MAG: hypothetical protein Hyperionvirus40_16 [Hyperionvirus sp.]
MKFSVIPFNAICVFFQLDDIIILRRTHRFFSLKLCSVASPNIILFPRTMLNSRQMIEQFPKGRFIIDNTYCGYPDSLVSDICANVTSLDLSECASLPSFVESALPSSLTSLSLSSTSPVKPEMFSALTRLIELKLNNNPINASILAKLPALRKLDLDNNRTLTDLDIEMLTLHSLSLGVNTTGRLKLKKLNLTHLNLNNQPLDELKDELIQCTTITDLEFNMCAQKIDAAWTLVNEMTSIKKLTINDWTYLERYIVDDLKKFRNVAAFSLFRLETFVLGGAGWNRMCFPRYGMEKLSRLVIYNAHYCELNFRHLKNLTELHLGNCILPANTELAELKNLRRLKFERMATNRKSLDISPLGSLTSLEFLKGAFHSFVNNNGLVASGSLERLVMDADNSTVSDNKLKAFPNLKYLSLGRSSCKNVMGSCFAFLHNLFSLEINEDHRLDKGPLASLRRRGILIRYRR